jgi:hypothetical protein
MLDEQYYSGNGNMINIGENPRAISEGKNAGSTISLCTSLAISPCSNIQTTL